MKKFLLASPFAGHRASCLASYQPGYQANYQTSYQPDHATAQAAQLHAKHLKGFFAERFRGRH